MEHANKQFDLSMGILVADWDGSQVNLVPEEDIKKSIEKLRKTGFTAAMIGALHKEEPSSFDLIDGATMIGKLFKTMGMKISSHHCHLSTLAPLDQGQEKIHLLMRDTIEFCAPLGTDTLVFHLGRVKAKNESHEALCGNFIREREKHGVQKVNETVVENITFMADLASQHNMRIALENVGYFEPLGSMETLPEIVEAINKSNVGYCLDTGHAHAFGESNIEWLKIMKGKLFTTHLNDNSGRLAIRDKAQEFFKTKGVDEHLPPGFGTINWVEIIKTLNADNYDGILNFECAGWKSDQPYSDLIHWWRTCETLAGE